MASASTSRSQPAKARKRVDAGLPGSLKRGSNGSAFVKCNSCNKDIPAATVDMHDCVQDAKSKVFPEKPVEAAVKEVIPPPKAVDGASDKKTQKKRKPTGGATDKSNNKKGKQEKDPNVPKRPATAFFLFMEEFRKTYKEANPNAKGGTTVAKEGGEKWKSLSDEDKAPFLSKANELKEEYAKAVKAYKSSTQGESSAVGSSVDNSRSEKDEEGAGETAGSSEYAHDTE